MQKLKQNHSNPFTCSYITCSLMQLPSCLYVSVATLSPACLCIYSRLHLPSCLYVSFVTLLPACLYICSWLQLPSCLYFSFATFLTVLEYMCPSATVYTFLLACVFVTAIFTYLFVPVSAPIFTCLLVFVSAPVFTCLLVSVCTHLHLPCWSLC